MKNKEDVIYINGRFLTQNITGVQRYAIETVKQLDKIETECKFIILVPKKDIIQKLEFKNIEVRQIGNLTGQLWEQISLPIYIFTHRKGKLLNLCNLAPILYPSYVTIHDISFKTHPEHLDKKFSLWYRFITRLNIKRYKHIFTDSEFSKREIIDNYKINVNKITVTYCSAEHLKEIKSDENIIKKLGLENKKFYFSLGSKSPHKNHKFIIECAKKNPDLLFVVSGNNNNKVFKNEEKYNENINNLIYTGYLNDNELVAMYKNCYTFIFPSLYEGFGIPPLEAMTMECKNIILSDIPVLKEVYGNSVVYLDTNKSYMKLESFIKLCNENDVQKLIKKYSWKTVANIIIKKIGG